MRFRSVFRLFCFLTSIVCFSACMDIRAVDKHKEDEAAPTVKAAGGTHFVFPDEPSVQTLAEPHKYQVVFPVREDGTVLVERESRVADEKGEMKTTRVTRMLQVQDFKAIDTEIVEGVRYIYRWGEVQGKRIHPTAEKEVLIPTDLVIEGEKDSTSPELKNLFGKKSVWGRVFFQDKAVLTTQGQDLHLEMNELIANDGVLRSFKKGSAAKQGDGKSGGKIFIGAEKASGSLKIELRGEDGGDGLPGKDPDVSLKGEKGARGFDAQYSATRENSPMLATTSLRCVTQATNGAAGFTGRPGFKGEQGGRGGETSSLELQIKDDSQFHMEWIRDPGHGGSGGLGGLGGEGGDGGSAGKLPEPAAGSSVFVVSGSCLPAEEGRPGPKGPRGLSGDRGFDGRSQPVCVWKDLKRECEH